MKEMKSFIAKMYRAPGQQLYWDRDYMVIGDRAEKMGYARYNTWRNSDWGELTELGRAWIEHQEV